LKILGVVLLVTFLIYLFYSPRLQFDVLENPNKSTNTSRSDQSAHQNNQKDDGNPKPKEGIGTWIGKDISYLTKKFGQADRSYRYSDHYKNYVFKQQDAYYVVLVRDKRIKSVYATGENANVAPLKINDSAARIFENTSINPDPTFKVNNRTYHFELSDEDLKTQTLIKYGENYAQVYVDQQTNDIMGIRYLDKEALVLFKPYRLEDDEQSSKSRIKHSADIPFEQNPNQLMTLYEITNEIRKLKGIKPMRVNSDIAHIAAINLYDATDSDSVAFTEDTLRNQLENQNIEFKTTSQNVGYDFDDVPTLIHSWMNSDIHRSRLLNKKYNEMGGEVMKNYYSLIFVEDK